MTKPQAAFAPRLSDWQAIRGDVLGRIRAGHWKPGETIPREVDLAAMYGCTRATVGRALRDLAAAGFLERRRKGGTTVAANPVRKAPLEVPIITEAIRASGADPGYRLIGAGMALPPPYIPAGLGLPPAAQMLHVMAVYTADGMPHQFESRWLNPAVVAAMSVAGLAEVPVDEWLLHHAPLTRAMIEISAVPAPGPAAQALVIAVGAPTLLVSRSSWQNLCPIGHLSLFHHPGFCLRTAIRDCNPAT